MENFQLGILVKWRVLLRNFNSCKQNVSRRQEVLHQIVNSLLLVLYSVVVGLSICPPFFIFTISFSFSLSLYVYAHRSIATHIICICIESHGNCYTFTHNTSSGTTSKNLPSATARYFMLCFDRDFLASTPSRRDMWRLLLHGKPRKKRVTAGGWNNGMLWGSNGEASETFFGRGQLNRFWNWKLSKDGVDDLKSLFDIWFWCGRVCSIFFRLMWMVSDWCRVVRVVYYCPCKVWSGNWRQCTPRSEFWTCRSISIFGVYQSECAMFVPILCMKGHFLGVIEIPRNSTPCKDWLLDWPSIKKPGNVQWENVLVYVYLYITPLYMILYEYNFQRIDSHAKCYPKTLRPLPGVFALIADRGNHELMFMDVGGAQFNWELMEMWHLKINPRELGCIFLLNNLLQSSSCNSWPKKNWVEIPFGVFSCNGIHSFQERFLASHSTQAPVLFLNQGNGAASW